MKKFLRSPAARRTAWMTLVALVTGFVAPFGVSPADAQVPGRTAYLVPFGAAAGMQEAEIPQRITTALSTALRKYKDQGKAPIDLIGLSLRNPVIKQGLEDGAITEDQVSNPPADLASAIDFARALGLTTVVVGTVESYQEAEDRSEATVDVTVLEYYIPATPELEPSIVRTVSKATTVKAGDEREKAQLKTTVSEKAALLVASSLLDAPGIAPVEQVETPEVTKPKGKGTNPLWIVFGVLAAVAGIFLISSIGGGGGGGSAGNLTVSNVAASSVNDAVQVDWTAVAGAIGYNVYRRQVGTQTIRSRNRQASGFTLLLNPETNTSPTVLGSNRTSYTDATATNGIIYEYAVTGVGPGGEEGPIQATGTVGQAGANIGAAPALTATAGNGFVALSWTASSSFVSGYTIFRRQGTAAPDTGLNSRNQLVQVTGSTRYDDTTVVNGTTYTYVVQPFTTVNVNGQLVGIDSNPITIVPATGAAPQAVRNVQVTVANDGRVLISWDPNPETNIDFYEILRTRTRTRSLRPSSSGNAPWLRSLDPTNRSLAARSNRRSTRQLPLDQFSIVGTSDSTITSFTDGPLGDGVYVYAVRAVNNDGQRGEKTDSAEVEVNAALPAPSGVRAVGFDRQVRISWQPVAGDVNSYSIYRSQTPITAAMTSPATAPGIARVGTVGSGTLVFDDLSLNNNVQFYYAVTVTDSQGAESDFGKGSAPDTGVLGIPHAAPAAMAFTVGAQNLSGNGQSTTSVTATLTDAAGGPTGGVEVVLSTEAGTFINLPSTATTIDSNGRQVRGLTDLQGTVTLDLRSSVVITPGQQLSVNLQARAAELPDAVELQSQTISFLASRPVVVVLSPDQNQLTADRASTTNVTASVRDALGQPVPDGLFSVDILLNSTNGSIRRSGNVQSNPFVDGVATVNVPVIGGQAVAVYRAGSDSSTQGNPPPNIVGLIGTVVGTQAGEPVVQSQTLITLVPGVSARVDFGQSSLTMGTGTTQTLNVIVRDAQGNPVRSGITVNFAVQPNDAPLTVPPSGTTDANGTIPLQITAGANAGGGVVIATITGTQVQSQLAVTVQ